MRYFLDTEFNEFGGELLSLALVDWEGETSLYMRVAEPIAPLGPWVAEHVWPIMEAIPVPTGLACVISNVVAPVSQWAWHLAEWLSRSGGVPYIISDWPDDIRYFCQAIITGPGQMAAIPRLQFDIVRVDAYPTTLPGAVQHNAWWDAMALRQAVTRMSAS